MTRNLQDRLPPVRGRFTPNAPLRPYAWLNAGGPAEVLFKPADKQDLIDFIKACPADIPVTALGVMSNTIIRDGGIPGVTIRMGRDMAAVEMEGETLRAGAGAMDMNVALACLEHGLAGLEFLSGIPGTIGGGLRTNAGAYGTELKDMLVTAEVLFRDGAVRHMTAAEMQLSHRHNALPDDVIFLSAMLKGAKGDKAAIESRMQEIKDKRAATQPIKAKTGGSTFANPEGGKAWELIAAAGCRGLKIGGAQMSEQHCNFMINTGEATAADLERLGEEVRRRVRDNSGIALRWEVRRIGVPLPQDKDIWAFMEKE